MKISLLFAWYDIWIGVYWDRKAHWLYILPIPTCGIILKFAPGEYTHLLKGEAGTGAKLYLLKDKKGYALSKLHSGSEHAAYVAAWKAWEQHLRVGLEKRIAPDLRGID